MLRRRLQMAGNSGSLLPPELQACEYLQTDGNCYIDTNFKVKDIDIKIDAKLSVDNSLTGWLFGCRISNISNQFGVVYISPNSLRYNYGASANAETNETTNYIINIDNGILKFTNFEGTGKHTINRGSYTFTSNYTIRLWGLNSPSPENSATMTKLYYFDFKNIGKLVACYIKAGNTFIDNKSVECTAGKPGMYDILNRVFYTNDGTGEFLHGYDIIL